MILLSDHADLALHCAYDPHVELRSSFHMYSHHTRWTFFKLGFGTSYVIHYPRLARSLCVRFEP